MFFRTVLLLLDTFLVLQLSVTFVFASFKSSNLMLFNQSIRSIDANQSIPSMQPIAERLIKAAAAAANPNSELKLFNFNWESVEKYFIVTIFLLIAIVIKIFHANFRIVHTYLPESCLLILCGIVIGFVKK
jgi:hypothetical protein